MIIFFNFKDTFKIVLKNLFTEVNFLLTANEDSKVNVFTIPFVIIRNIYLFEEENTKTSFHVRCFFTNAFLYFVAYNFEVLHLLDDG